MQAVKGIADLINMPGQINVDFADMRSVMKGAGATMMGTGSAKGENRAIEAASQAIDTQLLEDDGGIVGTSGVLVNISATESTLTLTEFREALDLIQEKAHDDANVIVGALFDEACGEELRVTVIATGLNSVVESNLIQIHKTSDL